MSTHFNPHDRVFADHTGDKFLPQAEPPRHFMRLGYSSIARSAIPNGIRVLADAIAEIFGGDATARIGEPRHRA